MVITTSESNNKNQATLEQIMQHIETLRQENEIIRKQADGERTQWLAESERRRVEVEAEHERLRKETAEARQRLDESMRQQEQLQKSNEELWAWMRERSNLRDSNIIRRGAEQDESHPLTRAIMEEVIPPHFLIPKVSPFTGEGDLEAHLKAFRAQMLISGALQNVCGNTLGFSTEVVRQATQRHHPFLHCLFPPFPRKICGQPSQAVTNCRYVRYEARTGGVIETVP